MGSRLLARVWSNAALGKEAGSACVQIFVPVPHLLSLHTKQVSNTTHGG